MTTVVTQRRDNKMDKYSKVYKKLNELRLQEIDKICEIYDSGHLPHSVALNIPADFIEVIRCKNCKYIKEHHYEEIGEPAYIKYTCSNKYGLPDNYQVHEWDYCSRGEKRDG